MGRGGGDGAAVAEDSPRCWRSMRVEGSGHTDAVAVASATKQVQVLKPSWAQGRKQVSGGCPGSRHESPRPPCLLPPSDKTGWGRAHGGKVLGPEREGPAAGPGLPCPPPPPGPGVPAGRVLHVTERRERRVKRAHRQGLSESVVAHPGRALAPGPLSPLSRVERSSGRRLRPHSRGGSRPQPPHPPRRPHGPSPARDTRPVLPQGAR